MAEERSGAVPVAADDWESHWGEYASSATDNPAQAFRRRLAFRLLAAHGSPTRLLDIGSGQGDLLCKASEVWPSADLVGLELSATGVAEGGRKVPTARFLQRDLLTDGPVPSGLEGWATHAVCSEVLEHVDDPALLLRHALPFLGPGCRVVVTVPGGPRSAFDRHIGHRRHFAKKSLTRVLADGGLDVETVIAAGFPIFNMYKLLVVARGERLVDDVRAGAGQESRAARIAMRAFGPMFRFSLTDSRWGWQLAAVGTRSAATASAPGRGGERG